MNITKYCFMPSIGQAISVLLETEKKAIQCMLCNTARYQSDKFTQNIPRFYLTRLVSRI